MTTRILLPDGHDPLDLVPLIPDLEDTPPPGPEVPRPRRHRAVSATSLRSFSATMGLMIGCGVGVAARFGLGTAGLATATPGATLAFVGGVGGLSLAFVLGRLMELARGRPIHVLVDGERREFPLRRRHEVVGRALRYVAGMAFGFAAALAAGWYALGEAVPQVRQAKLHFTPELQAYAGAALAAVATLALCEWVVRLTRKEGQPDHGAFVVVPAMATLGFTLLGLH